MSNSLGPNGLHHTRLPWPSLPLKVWSDSCPLSHNAIQQSYSLLLQSPPALNLFQHQDLFQWVVSLHQVAKVLELQLQQWIFSPPNEYSRHLDFLWDWLVWSPCCPRDSQESSPAPQFKSISSSMLSLLYGTTLKSIHDYWKNHSVDYMDLCQESDVRSVCCYRLFSHWCMDLFLVF